MLLECDSLRVIGPVRDRAAASIRQRGEYSLATGPSAVRRLMILHNIYARFGRKILLKAGLKPGMKVADFGCGVGMVSRMLAEIVGPPGAVVGIDASLEQVEQARQLCRKTGLNNTAFLGADATKTDLPNDWFDLVYC